jgi:hypothetical protein
MQRRRVLAGVGTVCLGLAGCLGAGEGKYARRISINGTPNGSASSTDTPTSQGLVLLDHEFYRSGSGGVRGRAANRGDVTLDFIAAYARFFDRSGTDIGHASDSQSDFEVGQTWEFNAQALDTDPSRVARYQLVLIDQRSSEVDPFTGTT